MKIQSHISILFGLIILSGCSSTPENNGMKPAKLSPCPDTPNCVNSQVTDFHAVAPFVMRKADKANWNAIVAVVTAIPRTKVVEQTDGYLHVEVSTLIFRFTDDMELLLSDNGATIDIRSASRLGLSDMGVNGRRVENLRKELKSKKLID